MESTNIILESIKSFQCPITGEVFTDPVIMEDGHSYERTAIEHWIRDHQTSPLTGEYYTSLQVIPNHTLRCGIEEFLRNQVLEPSINGKLSESCPREEAINLWLHSIGIPENDSIDIARNLQEIGFLKMEFLVFGDVDKLCLEQLGVKRGYIGQIIQHLEQEKKLYLQDFSLKREGHWQSTYDHRIKALESTIYELKNEARFNNPRFIDFNPNFPREDNSINHRNLQQSTLTFTNIPPPEPPLRRSPHPHLSDDQYLRARSASPTVPLQHSHAIPLLHDMDLMGGQAGSLGSNGLLAGSGSAAGSQVSTSSLASASATFQNVINNQEPVYAGFDVPFALSCGFVLQDNNTWAQSPYGPKMIVSDRICCAPDQLPEHPLRRGASLLPPSPPSHLSQQLPSTAQAVSQHVLYVGAVRWRFRASGNSSWAVGIVPESCINEPNYLHSRARIGLNSTGTLGGVLPTYRMHEKMVEIVADTNACTVEIIVDNDTVKVFTLTDAIGPFRLGFCGYAGTKIKLYGRP